MSARLGTMAGVLVWAAYVVIPNDAGGLMRGIPLGPLDAVALLMLAWLAVRRVQLPATLLVASVLIATAAASAAIPGSGGFRARYYADDSASGAHERSTEYRGAAFTRIDRRLDFEPGQGEFPLAFFNDNSRFNFFRPGEPDRRKLGFSTRWSGLWWVEPAQHHLYLLSPGASAEIAIDGVAILKTSPQSGHSTTSIDLTGGWHRLDVVFLSPYDSPRRFSAGTIENGESRPFDARSIVTQQVRGWQMRAYEWLRALKTPADILLLAALSFYVLRDAWHTARSLRWRSLEPIHGLSALALAGSAEALVFAWPWSRKLMVMTGGDDPMTYEGYARDILFNGILMNGGRPLWQGEPFYYQAFYPYFLAAVHLVFGEGMFGIVLVQRLLVVLLVALLVLMAMRLAGDEVWPGALGIAAAFAMLKVWPIARDVLSEALYVPLLAASVLSTLVIAIRPSMRAAIATGVLNGFAAITRSTALLGWPALFGVTWLSWRTLANRRQLVITFIVCAAAVFSLISIRNALVSASFAPTPSEFGVTLLGGNQPPLPIDLQASPRRAYYSRFRLQDSTAEVLEYAVTMPADFARNLWRKALFAVGVYEPYAPGWGYSPVYIAVCAGAALAFALPRRLAPWPFALPALVALSQYVAVVLIYPKGERLILPFHTLLVPYATITFHAVVSKARSARAE